METVPSCRPSLGVPGGFLTCLGTSWLAWGFSGLPGGFLACLRVPEIQQLKQGFFWGRVGARVGRGGGCLDQVLRWVVLKSNN